MIFLISVFLIGLVLLMQGWKGIPVSDLTRDITSILKVPPYIGFFSQIGICIWIATGAICLFTGSIISSEHIQKSPLFLSGLFTLLLGFDDMFQLHEQTFPYLFGISEIVVFGIYGLLVLLFLVKYHLVLLKTDYVLLALAFFFLGLSVISDIFPIPGLDPSLYENAFKMIGIVSWFFYFYSVAVTSISNQNNILH